MDFLTLGPLCIRTTSATDPSGILPRTVATAKVRALLAVLLIHSNQVIQVSRLIEEIWDDPPATAENVLRQYVSKLRKVLRGEVELCTFSAGYSLRSVAGATDAREFECLVDTSRRNLREGSPQKARINVDRAMQLWRGSAFADVPQRNCVTAECARLDELRTFAEQIAVEARLLSGDFPAGISELRSLLVRNPLREALYVMLMHALSAEGRRAEALSVYQNARETLICELGVEPGDELRHMHQSILKGSIQTINLGYSRARNLGT